MDVEAKSKSLTRVHHTVCVPEEMNRTAKSAAH